MEASLEAVVDRNHLVPFQEGPYCCAFHLEDLPEKEEKIIKKLTIFKILTKKTIHRKVFPLIHAFMLVKFVENRKKTSNSLDILETLDVVLVDQYLVVVSFD